MLFLPGLGVAVWASIGSSIDAIFSGEVEAVSPWAPVIWPFRLAIAVGLAALWLQALAETVRHGIGYFHPAAVRAPHEQIPH